MAEAKGQVPPEVLYVGLLAYCAPRLCGRCWGRVLWARKLGRNSEVSREEVLAQGSAHKCLHSQGLCSGGGVCGSGEARMPAVSSGTGCTGGGGGLWTGKKCAKCSVPGLSNRSKRELQV